MAAGQGGSVPAVTIVRPLSQDRGYQGVIGEVRQVARMRNYRLIAQFAAASIPTSLTGAVNTFLSHQFWATRFATLELQLVATAAVSGSPVTVALVVFHYDFNNNPVQAIGSPFAVTLNANTTGALHTPIVVTNTGDLIAIGVIAATAWAGGTLNLYGKGRG